MHSASRTALIRLSLALCALLLGACATRPIATAPRPPAVTFDDVSHGSKPLVVMLAFEDGAEFPFIVDTGAALTAFDVSLENRLGTRLRETTSNFSFYQNGPAGIHTAPKLFLGGTRVKTGERVICTKLPPSLPDSPVMGILGADCLKHYCIQLDFPAKQMRFLDPDRLDPSGLGEAIPLTGLGNQAFAKAELHGGGSPRMVVDTGMVGVDFMLKPSVFRRLLKSQKPLAEATWHSGTEQGKMLLTQSDAGGHSFINVVKLGEAIQSDHSKRDAALFTHMVVGDQRYPRILIAESTSQSWFQFNWMGLRFLARHQVTIDFPRGVIYLKKQPPSSAGR